MVARPLVDGGAEAFSPAKQNTARRDELTRNIQRQRKREDARLKDGHPWKPRRQDPGFVQTELQRPRRQGSVVAHVCDEGRSRETAVVCQAEKRRACARCPRRWVIGQYQASVRASLAGRRLALAAALRLVQRQGGGRQVAHPELCTLHPIAMPLRSQALTSEP